MSCVKFQVLTLIIQNEQVSAANKIIRGLGLASSKVLALGTVSSSLLMKMGILSDRRTMLCTYGKSEKIYDALSLLRERLHIDKPGHGIAFVTNAFMPHGCMDMSNSDSSKAVEEEEMFVKISVVVDRGMAQEVMTAARSKGARGGTIIHGRGSSEKEMHTIFGIEIEPEKELVFILAPKELSEGIIGEIVEKLELDKPGKGILFVEEVVSVVGLVEKHENKQ